MRRAFRGGGFERCDGTASLGTSPGIVNNSRGLDSRLSEGRGPDPGRTATGPDSRAAERGRGTTGVAGVQMVESPCQDSLEARHRRQGSLSDGARLAPVDAIEPTPDSAEQHPWAWTSP